MAGTNETAVCGRDKDGGVKTWDERYGHIFSREETPTRQATRSARRGRRCGCSGCLSGMECIDPYRAGGI